MYVCTLCASDAETALKMMMMTGSAAAVPLAALQAAGHRQRVQAAAASYLTSAGLRHVTPLNAISPPTMYVVYYTPAGVGLRLRAKSDTDP